MAEKLNLEIVQGDTFTRIIRWETPPFVYKVITAITQSAPVLITAAGHTLKSGWRVAVVSVKGMKEINAKNSPPRDSDFHQVTEGDANTISINTLNSADFSAYTTGGYLQFYTPVDMTGYTARMTIKDRIGGTVLDTLVSPTDITLDNTNHTITLNIDAATTELFTWTKGTYDLEMVSPSGVVVKLYFGSVKLKKEVTTP